MKRNMWNKLVFMAVLIIAVGCKAKKDFVKVETVAVIDKSAPKVEVLGKMQQANADFRTLNLRAKANLVMGSADHDVSMNIRIKKDEIIWVSVTAIAGIEVARVLITPDSVKVLNRLEASYVAKPFNYIHQFANRQINFKTLQNLLIGNTIPELASVASVQDIESGTPYLSGVLNGLIYKLLFDQNFKVKQTELEDKAAGQKLTVDYSDITTEGVILLPHRANINSAASNKLVRIDLAYNKITINESLEYPFNIPDRFTRKD